jgi:PAS domain S-box-containing protein
MRFFALMGSLVLVVFIGYLVRQRVSDETNEAFRWLGHSHQVRSTLYDLNATLAELQAAAYATRLAPGDATVRARYTEAHARFEPLLGQLRELTVDNPGQQERIGFLRARVDASIKDLDRLAEGQEVDAPLARAAIGDVTDDLLAEENRLALERQRQTDKRVAFAQFVTIATAVAQILLLGVVLWIAEKQTLRRLDAEAGARSAVGRARLIVESVREPIAVVDSNLALLQANQAFSEFYGIARAEGTPLDSVGGWRDAALQQRLRDVIGQRRELWDFETEQPGADGHRRRVIVNARAIDLPDTDRPAALVTVSDITARKHSEEQVLELNRQLSGKIEQVTEVNRELEAFSYSVSHDLRSPLNTVSGFCEAFVADHGQNLTPEGRGLLDKALAGVARMHRLIDDLLHLARFSRQPLETQPLCLTELAQRVARSLEPQYRGRSVELSIGELPMCQGDPSLLEHVLTNLLSNALKFTAARTPARIEVGALRYGPDYAYYVKDNGVGFDMKYADRLFGVFQRLHRQDEFPGTGIGLSIVHRIVKRHGGRTWAEGRLNEGATVYFTLPPAPGSSRGHEP